MGARRDSQLGPEAVQAQRYLALISLIFILILLRLFFLQVLQHSRHYKTSLDNVLRSVTIVPPRGTVLDRAGKPLAISKQNYGLLYVPPTDLASYMPGPDARRLLRLTGRQYHYRKLAPEPPDTRRFKLLDEQAEALFTACPDAKRIAEIARRQIGPPRHPGSVIDFESVVAASGLLQQQRAFQSAFAPLIDRSGLREPFNNDSDRLAKYHYNLPAAETLSEIDQQAEIQYRLIRDQYRLTRLYIQLARYHESASSSTRLEEIASMARFLNKPYEELMRRLDIESSKVFGHEPLLVADNLSADQWLYIAEHSDQFEHFIIEQYSFKREYPLGQMTSHLLGFTGPASEQQIENGYDQRERSGKSGIEAQYEEKLRGQLGRRDIEINKAGVYVAETALTAPQRGTDIYLSIDSDLQAKAFRLLDGRRGAIIVNSLAQETRGEILALTSSPSYDATRLREDAYYSALQANSWKPELNRAIGLGFPPGSTFKINVLTAALQSSAITPGTGWYCTGRLIVGREPQKSIFHCHERSAGHQSVNVYSAMSESCDVAFYEMGRAMDELPRTNAAELIRRFGLEYGFGAPTGIDLPGEARGTLPDREWKRKALAWTGREDDRRWYLGDTFNYSIGQGFLLTTPLQVLQSASILAWDGVSYTPHLHIATSDQQGLKRELAPDGVATELDKAAMSIVRAGMRQAVTSGTCRSLNLQGMNVCAKTGTAETKKGLPSHSWVVGYYPMENPRYGFVCFFEYGGSSGAAAVPAAKELLKYLNDADPLGRNPHASQPASTPAS